MACGGTMFLAFVHKCPSGSFLQFISQTALSSPFLLLIIASWHLTITVVSQLLLSLLGSGKGELVWQHMGVLLSRFPIVSVRSSG